MDITVIGHGSLMSGLGLSSSGTFQVKHAGVVSLAGCRRGFAKLSRYGDRFATDLEVTQLPLEGGIVSPITPPCGAVEALALTVPLEDFSRLAKREGYSPTAVQRLAELTQAHGINLADLLWQVHAEARHDVVMYRRRLFALTGFTSPHYIPHPVRLVDAGYAVIFLAPGFEGTGADDVMSVRQETGIHSLMSTREAWRRKPNEDQLAYFLSCLLGGVHGIGMHDLLATISEEPTLATELISRLRQVMDKELERFLATIGLPPEDYHRSFGQPESALARSGLGDFLGTTFR
ncbi:MAG TPA: hypothetical protein VGX03_12280 [Candidatus Binatia bacterium]|jgi:hypothetical protein|nr:hypothetical protein [Candidatus Binatia bacterium]